MTTSSVRAISAKSHTSSTPIEVDSTVWSLTANLLYRYRGRRTFVPYAAVGIVPLAFGLPWIVVLLLPVLLFTFALMSRK